MSQEISFLVDYHKPDADKRVETQTPSRRGFPITPTRGSDGNDLSQVFGRMAVAPKIGTGNGLQQPLDAFISPTGRSVITSPFQGTPSFSGHQFGFNDNVSPFPPGHYGYTPPPTLANQASNGNQFRQSPQQQSMIHYYEDMSTPSRDGRPHAWNAGLYSSSGRRQNAMRMLTSSPWNGADMTHNAVNIDRIQEGSDVRTTVCSRRGFKCQ